MATKTAASPPLTRWRVVGGAVTSEEFAEIDRAWQRAGFKNRSAFVRETVLERARLLNARKRRDDAA